MNSNLVDVNVTNVAVVSIRISPDALFVLKGYKNRFIAIVTLSDGSEEDVTSSAIWSSGNTDVVSVYAPGEFYGVNLGMTTVTVSKGGGIDTENVTVSANLGGPVLMAIDVGGDKLYTNSPSSAYADSLSPVFDDYASLHSESSGSFLRMT